MRTEIESIKTRIAEKNKQIEEVEDMMVSDRTNSDRYSKIIARYEKEIKELEFSAEMMRIANGAHIKPKLQYVISLINNMVMYIRDAPFEVKIKLIGSMFPEKIEFDGKQHRTKNMNKVLDLIYQQTNELRGNKKQNKANFFKSALSGESAGARTRDPNIKSVVLYLLSYGFIVCQSGYFPFLAVQM